jgi:arsenical resistance protein ArsH
MTLLAPIKRILFQPTAFYRPFSEMGSQSAQIRTLAQCNRLAISEKEDDLEIRSKYRPFLLDPEVESTDWISELELETAIDMAEVDLAKTGSRLKILVLYGSLRKRYGLLRTD